MNRAAQNFLSVRKHCIAVTNEAAAEIRTLPPMSDDAAAQAIKDIRTKFGLDDLKEQLEQAEMVLAWSIADHLNVTQPL